MKSEVNSFLKRGSWIREDRQEVEAKGYKPIGTKTVFKIKHEQVGSVVHIFDSEYAKGETRRSVSGGIHTLVGMIIHWSSKKRLVVSLSTSEAELIAYSERCQSSRIMQQLLKEILEANQTAVVFEDNQGGIYVIKNQSDQGPSTWM